MPVVKINDIRIYYEIHGAGEPVVLIAGLNSDHGMYRGILPLLAPHYQVIVFDNRGVGGTDKPDIPYSIEMMAEDTAGLLNALGIQHAHILGTSMGGRIASALVLRYPQMVSSLVLVSTTLARRETGIRWSRRQLPWQLNIPLPGGPHPRYAVRRQLEASSSYDCMDRLGEIRVPTLILHGQRDRLTPLWLAEEVHRGIQGSQMLTFPGGHVFFVFRPRQFVNTLHEFWSALKRSQDQAQGASL